MNDIHARKIIVLVSILVLVCCNPAAASPDVYARKYDEFHFTGWKDTVVRLDDIAVVLKAEPGNLVVFIVYGARRGRRGEAQAWGQCSKDYLVRSRGISADRIIFVNGGYIDALTVEVWLSPSKNHYVRPMYISSKDVKFRKGAIKNWRSLCKE